MPVTGFVEFNATTAEAFSATMMQKKTGAVGIAAARDAVAEHDVLQADVCPQRHDGA